MCPPHFFREVLNAASTACLCARGNHLTMKQPQKTTHENKNSMKTNRYVLSALSILILARCSTRSVNIS